MLFWVACLSALSLVCTYAPRGGVELAGIALFSGDGMIADLSLAMAGMGLSVEFQVIVFAIVSALNLAGAGLALFSMMFFVFGQEQEQIEARPLLEGASICAAVAASFVVFFSIAGNKAGPLLAMELACMAGLLLTVRTITVVGVEAGHEPDPGPEEPTRDEIDLLIARQAASHAAFTAQLANISRREREA